MIKINTPPVPMPIMLPADSQAAWCNGFRACAAAMEEAFTSAIVKMDASAKAALLSEVDRVLTGMEPKRRTTRQSRARRARLSCNHPVKYVEHIEHGRHICTLCGVVGEMRA